MADGLTYSSNEDWPTQTALPQAPKFPLPPSTQDFRVRCIAPMHSQYDDGQKPSRSLFGPFDTLRLCNATEFPNFKLVAVGFGTRGGCPFVELDAHQLDFLSHPHVDICTALQRNGRPPIHPASGQGWIAAGFRVPASWVLV